MRLYYVVGDCSFLEEVDQIFTLKVNQEVKEQDASANEVNTVLEKPCLAAVTHGQTVIMFSKDDISIKECNNKLSRSNPTTNIDLSDWKLINVVSLENFERARAAANGTPAPDEEGVKELDAVVGEVEEDD